VDDRDPALPELRQQFVAAQSADALPQFAAITGQQPYGVVAGELAFDGADADRQQRGTSQPQGLLGAGVDEACDAVPEAGDRGRRIEELDRRRRCVTEDRGEAQPVVIVRV
jgi:hypothetical protein